MTKFLSTTHKLFYNSKRTFLPLPDLMCPRFAGLPESKRRLLLPFLFPVFLLLLDLLFLTRPLRVGIPEGTLRVIKNSEVGVLRWDLGRRNHKEHAFRVAGGLREAEEEALVVGISLALGLASFRSRGGRLGDGAWRDNTTVS